MNSKVLFSYYGGKQNMIKTILPLIPPHKCYVEPFCGGAAVFFHKHPSKVEVLNDKNLLLMNFYNQAKNNTDKLINYIDGLMYHEQIHTWSKHVIKNPDDYTDLEKAVAFWFNINTSFSKVLLGGFAFSKEENTAKCFYNKKQRLKDNISRLENATLLTRDAIEVINMFDGKDTFFFIDPPYISADKGHYKDYNINNFIDLLNNLEKIKGKFMLTTYPEKELEDYTKRNNWKQISKTSRVSAKKSINGKRNKTKVEVITMNYNTNSFFDSYNEILNNS